ncbi:NADPH:quinone reductase [Streptomyces avermitilis]|uniref:NADPH:quinone reductase n=1 Tax=Streptomyces avermitilis TaxID=33903 RepID=A0A4D4N4L9_STRAX|nr:NADP-dependent oxidoreductase [Streptomyces avermitilis]KUN55268.1 NADPH:quinone reductase [Streptomyces avermitilis]OOV26630.1 NADPH:quinone reductase [Streptomyces avermitilis]BBJ48945.1 NADPH:quinone reductase [Streptomyces avermitilis]GDY60990.1 NADPH:quinone reductase [Streptomyces avermitilis]GDY78934.1 NADPH:quinone reductase [Streptomyces avermitilis]
MPKAYVFTRYGGPETEALVDLDRPSAGPGQLVVAVRAAGVNPVDWKQRTGYRRPGGPARELPAVFGNEVSGVVEETGEGVTGFAVGDEVFGNPVAGGYAQYAVLPVTTTAHKPAGLSFTDAATLPVAAATAYDGVRQLGLPSGATLLITGAGGGVGVAAVQLARAAGLRVVGVASEAKKDLVESLGAVHVPSGPELAERVRAAAPGDVDAVFDLVGGEVLEAAATLLTDRTKLITGADRETVARLGGAPVARARTAAVLDAVAALAVGGELKPYVTRTFPLELAAEALRTVEEGHARGKVVIEVAE